MQVEIDQLQSKLNQSVRGMIWVSKDPLSSYPAPFHALNHFLNGLLLKMEHNHEASEGKNLYCTQHFGKNFFLGHLNSQVGTLDKEIVSLMAWAKTQIEDGDKVAILDQSGKQVKKALEKKYPKLVFEEITLF